MVPQVEVHPSDTATDIGGRGSDEQPITHVHHRAICRTCDVDYRRHVAAHLNANVRHPAQSVAVQGDCLNLMRAERCVAPDHAVRRLCIDADLLPIREEGDRNDLADRIDGISLNRNRHADSDSG